MDALNKLKKCIDFVNDLSKIVINRTKNNQLIKSIGIFNERKKYPIIRSLIKNLKTLTKNLNEKLNILKQTTNEQKNLIISIKSNK